MSTISRYSHLRGSRTIALAVAAVLAASRAQAAEPSPSGGLEEITVFGAGQVRQVSALTAEDIATAAPGTSAIKVLDKLPGVSFQSSDPWGAYEWSTRISVRGFAQNQLGFTLDGVPLGDMSYGNHNGLHISRAISSENIGSTLLSQGAGALGTASSSNLGGTVAFYSRDPAKAVGVEAQLTAGAASTKRGYVRVESGELGSAGTRAYLSYTKQDADKWKGDGKQNQEQVNFKIVQPIGEGKLSAFYNYSNRAENDYQDLSLAQINSLGYNWDNLSGPVGVDSANWQTMLFVSDNYGGANLPAPFKTGGEAYFNASGLRKDKLGGVSLNLPIAANADWDTTVYVHKNEGEGVWFAPNQSAPVGAPDGFGGTIADIASIAVRTTEYSIDRKGFTSALSWTVGAHKINGGIWYEKNDFDQARRYYGLHRSAPQRDSLKFMRDPYRTKWQFAFNTKTTQFFVQDTWTVNNALRLNFGFKSLDVKNQGTEQVIENTPVADCTVVTGGSAPICGSLEAKKSFLPQVGFNYSLDGQSELFGDITRNMRAFVSAATGTGVFSTSANGLALLESSGVKPETSTTYEFGWRYNSSQIRAVATVYYVDFKDRLLVLTVGNGIVGNQNILQNVGGVRTKGAELGIDWHIAPNWGWYNSLSYNDSTYQDNVVTHTVVPVVPATIPPTFTTVTTITPTEGKTVVDAPKSLFKSELSYDDGHAFGKLAIDCTGSRFFTYTNDQQVAAYTLVNLSAGYHWADIGFAKKLTVQGNVYNLGDSQYVSTVGSNGFGNSGDGATLQVGAPRQFFASVSAQF